MPADIGPFPHPSTFQGQGVEKPPRTILVTGATGFTGPFVVRELRSRFPQARLRCVVRPTSDVTVLDGTGAEPIVGDLRDEASLDAAFAGATTLVNVASLGFDWVEPLFRAIARSSLERGIFLGTTAMLTGLPVRSRPIRERAEARVRESGLAWTILRPTMIYGTPRDRNIARLIRFILRWPVVPVVAPEALQQPVHVEDVAAAVGAALATDRTVGRAYNLAGRDPITFETMVRTAIAATGRRRLVLPIPYPLVLGGAMVYGSVARRPRVTVEQVRRLRENKSFDYRPAQEDFGFTPRSFEEGVRAEVRMLQEWYASMHV